MKEKEAKHSKYKKLYIIEYDNGESFEDNWNYTLDVAFESLDNAIDYVKSTYVEPDPDDYDDEVAEEIPVRRYYIEDDEFEDNCYSHYEGGSSYTIKKIRVIG